MVAVLNKVVVDHDRELVKLVERLRRKYSEVYNEIAVEYLTVKEIELILYIRGEVFEDSMLL